MLNKGGTMSKKKTFDILLSILFLMLIIAGAIIILPNMFASTDKIADANNITTSEYATQYSVGQDFLQMLLIVLYIVLVILAIIFFVTVVKMIM